jgi:hypothetical protein
MRKPPSQPSTLQLIAMDLLIAARKDPQTRPHTFQHHINNARRAGLTMPEIAAGLGRPVSFVERILANGGA